MVVVFHLQPQLERMGYTVLPGDWFMAGVDIFFVISGFIMWWTTRDIEITPLNFMKRRFLRIAPLYWAITLFYVVILLVAPSLMQTGRFDPRHVISSFLFLPYVHPVSGGQYPLVVPGWTLNFEMYFYVIFAACLWLPRNLRLGALIVLLAGLVAIGAVWQPRDSWGYFYTSPLILEFLLGILLAECTARRLMAKLALVPVLLVVGFGAIPLTSHYVYPLLIDMSLTPRGARAVTWGIPAGVLIYAAVSAETRITIPRRDWLLFLGNASFSIYVTHQLTMSAAGQVWRRVIGGETAISYVGFCLFGLSIAIGLGCLSHRFVERPLNRWARLGLDHAAAAQARWTVVRG